MVDVLKTVGGWVLVGAVGGLYWYYTQGPNRARQAPRRGPSTQTKQEIGKQTQRQQGREKKSYASDTGNSEVKGVGSAADSGSEKTNNRGKMGLAGKSSAAEAAAAAERPLTARVDKDDEDNRAFAAQLAKTQQGTKLKAPETASQKIRTTKQGKANKVAEEMASSKGSSTPASTAGADADDDLSPRLSPDLPATAPETDASGVADMLEAAAPGPSSLRITAPKEPERQQKPKPAKKEPEVETKKQRQRRKKNEERKEAAAEAEKERKKLMDLQMKQARTLEGTSRGQRNDAAPTTNAWANKKERGEANKPAAGTALLDTFEPVKNQVTEAVKAVAEKVSGSEQVEGANGTNGIHSTTDQSSSDLNGDWETVPPEILDEGWQSATTKKSKKNKKKAKAAAEAAAATTSESGS